MMSWEWLEGRGTGEGGGGWNFHYWQNKYITATHDQTAAREKEGMSEGERKKQEGETHSSIFHGASLQLNLLNRR